MPPAHDSGRRPSRPDQEVSASAPPSRSKTLSADRPTNPQVRATGAGDDLRRTHRQLVQVPEVRLFNAIQQRAELVRAQQVPAVRLGRIACGHTYQFSIGRPLVTQVRTYVMSATQSRSGRLAVKSRSTRSGGEASAARARSSGAAVRA
ncbi:hypothetical protein OHT76_06695 [Streptomyces sp. NBC_00287]|uniref:hypothetical protein n=1 Tax=Streptomyces sp. NBC_00287 TaxID=2975702 RepID=UPI002E2AF555|nr:hypothetical protein [Streptomyces sp. NBC_00287]